MCEGESSSPVAEILAIVPCECCEPFSHIMLSARHHRDSKAPSRCDSKAPSRSFSLPEALCESGSDKMRELRNLSSNSLDEHQMSLSSARRRGDAEEENLILVRATKLQGPT